MRTDKLLELLLLAVGLAMDAGAVAAASGLAHHKAGLGRGLKMAAVFGAFQAGMPCIGWLVGSRLAGLATRFTPWIAFVILLVLGAKMIRTAIRGEAEGDDRPDPFAFRALIGLGVATSLDALAVGVTLPLLGLALTLCATVIGVVTFVIAGGAFHFGRALGDRIGKRFEVAGGIALIGVGVKLLFDHLFA